MYENILKPILFKFDPERIHDLFVNIGEFAGKFAIGRWKIALFYNYRGKDISKTVDGIKYRTPFLLSAGFDCNGRLMNILPSIGLGGEEIGSVTARPCEGNKKPRLTRLPKSDSILVNKGLRNDGVDVIIERIKRYKITPQAFSMTKPFTFVSSFFCSLPDGCVRSQKKDLLQQAVLSEKASKFVLGISIARTNDDKSVPIDAGIEDYVYSFKRLNEENIGDYYTLNISCPNSFGGEAFTEPNLLSRLLVAIKKIPCSKPVYVKMPINLKWDEFKILLDIIDKNGLQGVVIGNLNKNYDSLLVRDEAPSYYCGGLSGKPCLELSTELIKKTREAYGKRFTIIGCGGVMSAETAKEKFDAGADLVQVISGLIFKGPGLVKEICKVI